MKSVGICCCLITCLLLVAVYNYHQNVSLCLGILYQTILKYMKLATFLLTSKCDGLLCLLMISGCCVPRVITYLSLCVVHFLPRDALVHSAVFRLHVVHLSVRLSVMLVDQDHIGWKSWKLIAQSIRPTPLLFVAQRPST